MQFISTSTLMVRPQEVHLAYKNVPHISTEYKEETGSERQPTHVILKTWPLE